MSLGIEAFISSSEESLLFAVEKDKRTRHVTTIKENKWKSLLGFMAMIVAVLYPFKMFYEELSV